VRPADPAPTEPAGGPPRRRRGYFLPGIIALAALLAIGAAIGAGDLSHPAPKTLGGPDVASELAFGIEGQVGATSPPPVSCPATVPVRDGYRFRCTTILHGSPRPVAVVEIDTRGHLRWSLAGP
jgi:Domain of unknown function (DUF4333)